MLGVQADGGAIGLFRFDRLALRSQDDTEIVVCVGVIRIDGDGALVRAERFVQPELILQDDPQVAVPVRALGSELEAPLDQRDCLLAPRLLMGEHSRVVQSVGVVGRDLEDAAVDLARSRPLLVLLQHDGERYRLVQAEGTVILGRLLHAGRGVVAAARVTLPCCP